MRRFLAIALVASGATGCRQLLGLDDSVLAADDARPTRAVRLGGQLSQGLGRAGALAGVDVLWVGADGKTVATTSDAAGAFALSISTTGSAIDGYLHAQLAGYLDSDYVPAGPIAADQIDVGIAMVTPDVLTLLADMLGVQQLPGTTWIAVHAISADRQALPGMTVSTTPAGVVRYDGDSPVPTSVAAATGKDGQALVFDVPPGAVTIAAMDANGNTSTTRSLTVVAGRLTFTEVIVAP